MLYLLTQTGFILLTVIFYYLLFQEFKFALPKTTLPATNQKRFLTVYVILLVVWAIIVSVLSIVGFVRKFENFPFNIGPLLLIPLIVIIIFTFSKPVKEVLGQIQPARIIRLQVFRIFVEILLWMLVVQNLLPVQMSFEGRNFDILSGLTAALVAFLVSRNKISKSVVIIWNLVCLGLLINIVTIAILSMPTPFRYFMNEPSNTVVALFPISWLPTFLVPLAYMLHFLSLRQLTLKK